MAITEKTPTELAGEMEMPSTASPAAILFFNCFREEIFEVLAKHGWIKNVKPEEKQEGADHGDATL